jgi:F-type H+-transporting ATPase subunit gamma
MATLREISNRLKAVTNIQKITKSMKIVSQAKFARAQRGLKSARAYGEGAGAFYECAEVTQDPKKPDHLIIAMSSDRGLCGGIHSNIFKAIRNNRANKPAGTNIKLVAIGDKQRGLLGRYWKDDMLMHFADVGKKPPSFADASLIAQSILDCGFDFDHGELYYNVFKTVVSYKTTVMPIYNAEAAANAEKIGIYDSIDEEVMRSYNEFSFASLIFFALKEGTCSELSSRMTSMEAASKNAGEMIDKLAMLYNRKRQSVITTELIEIISGAAALE